MIMKDVCQSERQVGNVVVVNGLEVGIRYFARRGSEFIAEFQPTPSLEKAGQFSRDELGHGYVFPKISPEGEVTGYEVPRGEHGEDTVDVAEEAPYTVSLETVGYRE